MKCRYCTWGSSKAMRYYSMERVFEDLDLVLSRDSIESIYFCDSSILLNRKRAVAILRHILDANTDKAIRFELNAEHLDDELTDLIVQLPRMEFNFGLQTINPEALREMDRSFNRELFEKYYRYIVSRCGESSVTIDLIYGLPGDNYEGYKASMEYVISLGAVKRILTNPLIVLPGSEYFREMDKYGISLRDRNSFLAEKSDTFSSHDMRLARELSFYVSVIYLNRCFRNVFCELARARNKKCTDVILELFESLPFKLVDGDCPDMIPTIKEGFEKRNMTYHNVVGRYNDIVSFFKEFFQHEFDAELDGYEAAFTDHYRKVECIINSGDK